MPIQQKKILILGSEAQIMGRWFKRLRPLVKLHHYLPLGFRDLWYRADWKSRLADFELVIIFENYWAKPLIQYIRAANPSCRVIVYYLNPIQDGNGRFSPAVLGQSQCELYSFDRSDCKTFNMKYNPWCLPTVYPLQALPLLYDTFFIGMDKGRLETLLSLKRTLDGLGLRNRFIILKDKRKNYAAAQRSHVSDERVPYEAVVQTIQQSRCLVEILQQGQSGITERSLEALVYRKKLITNNPDIVSYDFYRKENVFVLGTEPIAHLRTFMDSQHVPVEDTIAKRYTYEAWLRRFFPSDPNQPRQ